MLRRHSTTIGAAIARRVVLVYLLAAALWIFGSDRLLAALVSDVNILTQVQTLKGWGFVAVTALLLYWLVWRYTRVLSETNRALQERDAHVSRLNRIHRVLSASNGAILRIRDRDELINEACRIAVDLGRFRMAWVGLLDPATDDVICAAHSGVGREFIERTQITKREDEPTGRGLVGWTLRDGRRTVTRDVHDDPRMSPWAAGLKALDVRSAAAFPLRVHGRVIGALTLYSREPSFFDEDELRLLDEVAGDTSLGIEYIETMRQLDYLAYYDPLTGLPNRQLFEDRLRQALAVAQRAHESLVVLVVAISDLREISNTLGRHAGDETLQACANRLAQALSASDSVGALAGNAVARMSGHEFGILLTGNDVATGAQIVAQRLRDVLAESLRVDDNEEVVVDARIGAAVYPDHGQDPATLLRNAELALHSAPDAGAPGFQIYSAELDEQARERHDLERALRQALDRGEFFLVYQPKVQANTGKIVGAEALLRWRRPQVGVVPPNRFIPLLEETGLIVPVGHWVIQEACANYRKLAECFDEPVSLAVNISVAQLADPKLTADVAEILERSGVPPGMIELEITESGLAENAQSTLDTLRALKRLGLRLAIDDFGTGFSSLSYLRVFPVDTLKIDRSFVRDVAQNPEAHSIVRTVIALAASLRLDVVAEGVETESQLAMLLKEGCSVVQGYYFSPPVTLDAIGALAANAFPIPATVRTTAESTPRLLVLDDEPNVVSALERVLRGEDYEVLTATDPLIAFDLLATHRVQVLLCDLNMPVMSGTEFLRKTKSLYPKTVRLILTGLSDLQIVTEAVNTGFVTRLLTKPWDDEELRVAIRDAFREQQAMS